MPGYQACRNLLFAVLFLSAPFLPSHSAAQIGTGLPPHGSFAAQQIDTINLANLNVHIGVPLLQVKSRGYRIWYELSCDSNFYIVDGNFTESYPAMPGGACLFSRHTSKPPSSVEYSVAPSLCDPSNTGGPYSYSYSGFVSIDNNNTYHTYNVTTTDSTECGGGKTTGSGYADDGSGFYLTATGSAASVTGMDGVPSGPIGSTPMDTNGNMITDSFSGGVETLTDASGAQVTEATSPFSQGNPYTDTVTYDDSNGHPQSIVATYGPYMVEATPANFGLPYGPIQIYMLSSVALPDGTSYQLAYEPSPGVPGRCHRAAGFDHNSVGWSDQLSVLRRDQWLHSGFSGVGEHLFGSEAYQDDQRRNKHLQPGGYRGWKLRRRWRGLRNRGDDGHGSRTKPDRRGFCVLGTFQSHA